MTTQKAQDSPTYAEQVQEIDQELKAQNRILPASVPVFCFLWGLRLLI